MKKIHRYPGVEPFQIHHKDVFEGRADDIQALYQLLQNEQQVLLYAKSGLGKSSLINAGLQPLLAAHADTTCLNIRFSAYVESSQDIDPIEEAQLLTNAVKAEMPDTQSQLLDRIIPNETSFGRPSSEYNSKTPMPNTF